LIIILKSEEIYFVNWITSVEIYFYPVRPNIRCSIIPATAGSPVQSFAIAVIDRGDRVVATVSG
jgi:hypothetical protein